jgi:hypothetical protein
MYASSYFYAPTHPTVEDQVELARRISNSLSDVKNVKSKGQSMYVNRKKRSVKWIHDGNGKYDTDTNSPMRLSLCTNNILHFMPQLIMQDAHIDAHDIHMYITFGQ